MFINTNYNNTKPIQLFSSNLERIYIDKNINGSITNLVSILNKLKTAIEDIIKYQEIEKNIIELETKKINIDVTINMEVMAQIETLTNELESLELKIDNQLDNI